MQLTVRQNPISKDELLNRVDPLVVYEWYVPGIAIKKNVCSPLRKDNHPSWGIYKHDEAVLWKDWGTGESGDCVKLVMQMFGIGFKEAISKIAQDLGIVAGDNRIQRMAIAGDPDAIEDTKSRILIQCTTKRFTAKDKQYWAKYGITEQMCKENQIWSLKEDEIYINRIKWPMKKGEIAFGYWYEEQKGWKLLFPEKCKELKWRNNIKLDTPEGLENLDKDYNTLIVKSKKCYVVMKQIYPHCCAMQNEGVGSVTKKTAQYINENSKGVWYGGDSDPMGKKASYKITDKYHWKHINVPDRLLPDSKDWSDWYRAEGPEPIYKHLQTKGIIT